MGRALSIKGRGSIEKLDRNRWRIRVSLGRDPVTKKYRRSPSRVVHGSKSDAIAALEAYRSELRVRDATIMAPSAVTVDGYARTFHSQREGALKSPLSYKREGLEIRNIEQYFGGYFIGELSPHIIRETYLAIRKGELMSESELHKMHGKLSQVMKQAVADALIPSNPCASISVPRPPAKERGSLTAQEAARLGALLQNLPRTAKHAAVVLGLHTGIRRGEALGLMRKYVDLDGRRIGIGWQYDADGVLREPKGKRKFRWISISDECAEYLGEWFEAQERQFADVNEERRRKLAESGRGRETVADLEVTGDTPVVSNEHGGFTDPNVFSRWFRAFCVEHGYGEYGETEHFTDAAGRRRIRRNGYQGLKFHELRHTQATLLIGSGADIKTVQTRLGHSSAQLTMNTYAHAIEDNDRAAADTIGGILSGR